MDSSFKYEKLVLHNAYVFCYDWFEANGLLSTIGGNREIDYYTRRHKCQL